MCIPVTLLAAAKIEEELVFDKKYKLKIETDSVKVRPNAQAQSASECYKLASSFVLCISMHMCAFIRECTCAHILYIVVPMANQMRVAIHTGVHG